MTHGNIDTFSPDDYLDVKNLTMMKKIISNSIKTIDLNLSGKIILTEAATGNWISTPLIAAFSNAKKILCFAKDSKYGEASEIEKNFLNISKFLGLENQIHVFTSKNSSIISEADVITNSGLLRPLDTNFIKLLKKEAVISLMWEPWELRPTEIDLSQCQKQQIPVLGVNEHNSVMNIMKYDGQAIVEILSQLELLIKNKNIILVGENLSALYMYEKLQSLGAHVSIVSELLTDVCAKKNIPILSTSLENNSIEPILEKSDLIIVNSIPLHKEIIGNDGLSPEKLKQLSPNVSIVIYFGNVDYNKISQCDLKCFPSKGKSNGYMNWTVDILGQRPTIELNSLGLKVGEILSRNRKISKFDTEQKALETPYCLDFSKEQKQFYFKEK